MKDATAFSFRIGWCDEVDSRAKILAPARDHGSEEMMPKRKTLTVRMRIRIYAGDRMLGPGKMELLSHIDETGSLSAAAKQMGMSYMRAWTLAKELNRDRSRPMVEMSRGGARGGTAKVTRFGRKILTLYQKMERAGNKAAGPYGRRLARLLK